MTPCALWLGQLENNGYARVRRENSRERIGVHRMAWELVHGPIPDGLHVLHRCDVRNCVNADEHLFLGTSKDNTDDMFAKGRANKARGARHGMAKKSEKEILRLIADYKSGRYTQKELATKYALHPIYVNNVLTGKSWSHLPR